MVITAGSGGSAGSAGSFTAGSAGSFTAGSAGVGGFGFGGFAGTVGIAGSAGQGGLAGMAGVGGFFAGAGGIAGSGTFGGSAGAAGGVLVGPSGATVTAPSGAEIAIPSGALSSTISITVAEDVVTPPLPAGVAAAGTPYDFGPSGTTFAIPVTVRVPVAADALNAALFTYPPGGPWQLVPGSSFVDGYAEGQVTHFSFFVGAVPVATGAGGGAGTTGAGGGVGNPEICNGLDDNGNGTVDEGFAVGGPCAIAGAFGPCASGQQICDPNGGTTCQQILVAGTETCNGLDDDCDGTVDDGFNLATDLGNCGSCGTTCSFPNAVAACAQGKCALGSCTKGFSDLDGSPANGCEYFCTFTGDEICDGKDNDCNGGVDEGCSCSDGATKSCYGGDPATIYVGQCKGGTAVCSGGSWGACEGEVLPVAETCNSLDDDCDNQVDEDFDKLASPTNCGTCGNLCSAPGATSGCVTGSCTYTCSAGFVDANAQAADGCEYACTPSNGGVETCDGIDNDCEGNVDDIPDVAGDCSAQLPGAVNATFSCGGSNGCGVDACVASYANCDTDPANGCETSLRTLTNCGGCSIPCSPQANAVMTCDNGQCEMSGCQSGFADLNGLPQDGCESSCVPSGAEVCNGVDDDCNGTIDDAPGAGQPCGDNTGACQSGTQQCGAEALVCVGGVGPTAEICNGVDDDCNGIPDDGIDAQTDCSAQNPGVSNVAWTCFSGCQQGGCQAGWGDCDTYPVNGCEQSLDTATNCGACGTSCAATHASSSTCGQGGVCLLSCDAGYGDCDLDGTNGCEVNLTNDSRNCGGCNYPCGGNTPVCDGGSCATALGCSSSTDLCGAGNQSCCWRTEVAGGSFYRGFDGVTHTDMSFPVTLSTFRMDVFEVTVARFRAFVQAVIGGWVPSAGAGLHTWLPGGQINGESGWTGGSLPSTSGQWDSTLTAAATPTWTSTAGANENKPINVLQWSYAYAFCIWSGGALPTDAEFNYAQSGGAEQRVYPWSVPPDSTALDPSRANYACLGDGNGGTCALTDILRPGILSAGRGRYGQLDLVGGVREFVLDSSPGLAPGPCSDCAYIAGPTKLVLGGSWKAAPNALGVALRENQGGTQKSDETGFRCVYAPLGDHPNRRGPRALADLHVEGGAGVRFPRTLLRSGRGILLAVVVGPAVRRLLVHPRVVECRPRRVVIRIAEEHARVVAIVRPQRRAEELLGRGRSVARQLDHIDRVERRLVLHGGDEDVGGATGRDLASHG
jgi:formylglycine-generating enzyme required for sulfatase activity